MTGVLRSARISHIVLTVLKYAFAFSLLWLVLSSIDHKKVFAGIFEIGYANALISLCALFLAQIISSFRMRYYLEQYGLKINIRHSISLCFAGMFYNLVLPGGIGGDAYKILHLKRKKNFSAKRATYALISERGNGLLALILLLPAFFAYTKFAEYFLPIAIFSAISAITYFFIVIKYFKESLETAIRGLSYSIFVQILFVLSVVALLSGIDTAFRSDFPAFIGIFLVSSVFAALLPITVGGVGIREATYMVGAPMMGVSPEAGVTVAIAYYVVYVICSLPGLLPVRHQDTI